MLGTINQYKQNTVDGIAGGLLKDVVKTEMTMHYQQIEAWQWMFKNPPIGDDINTDILKGITESRCLSINELNLDFHIKPVQSQTLWQRIKLAIAIITGKSKLIANKPVTYMYCNESDKLASKVNIAIKRAEKGKYEYETTE